MQTYQRESTLESDVFNYKLKGPTTDCNNKVRIISKKYNDMINKLESGEGGDNEKIDALELSKCNEINSAKEKYLADISPLVNIHAQRREYISRKFYRDYAYWAPFWMPETTISFPSIEIDYLKDLSNILSEYKIVNKSDCSVFEKLPKKDGVLQEWEDEFCANFRGKIGFGPAKVEWDCNSWKIEGGEGIVGELGNSYSGDGSFDSFTIGVGFGESLSAGAGGIAEIEAGASVKEFIKVGSDKSTGNWEVKDFGVKGGISLEGKGLGVSVGEINVAEVTVAVNAGIQAGGVVAPLFNLN
jgi:hypothetical protein